ncbi:MAG: M48 family metallopeptidase [Bacteroidales bacterium]
MEPKSLFYLMVGFLVFSYILERVLEALNLRYSRMELPEELRDVFDPEAYRKSQSYKRENTRFSLVSSSFSLVLILGMFFLKGFAWLDGLVAGWTGNPILHVLLFFGVLAFASDLLGTPFEGYQTFVIEEKYGFNRTTPRTFFLDKAKGWLIGAVLGGGLLALITWIYFLTGPAFWWIALGVMILFYLFINLFYSNLIVPLFNKQTPLEKGSLRDRIEAYASKVSFALRNVYVMDGSKRSTKANAYFTGLGPKKRVVLFDTLIGELSEDEIVSVLAHEIGHYKRKHSLKGMGTGILQTALTLYLFSLSVALPEVSMALGGSGASFHLGLIAFAVLFAPVSTLLGLGGNVLSRRRISGRYARESASGEAMVSALKKLSRSTLSNLTPHPAYVFVHYSHPRCYGASRP